MTQAQAYIPGIMNMRWVLEYTDTADSKSEAATVLDFLMSQEGYISGRVLEPKAPDLDKWRIQAFFPDEDNDPILWPDGCKRRLCPESLLA